MGKSLNAMIQRYVKRKKYEHIVIVHDSKGLRENWREINKGTTENVNIVWFAPVNEFSFIDNARSVVMPVQMTNGKINQMLRKRDSDYTLEYLVNELQHMPKWETLGNFRWSYLTNHTFHARCKSRSDE